MSAESIVCSNYFHYRYTPVNLDIINKAGAWFSFNEEKLGQGREKAKEYLEQNPDILAQVETLVREKLAQ